MHALLHSVPPALQQATADPHLCRRLLDTHGQVWVHLLWGHCSFLLVLVWTRFCLCPPRVCFPVLWKFWRLYGGVNGDLLQEGLSHTQVCCTQSPCPCGRALLTRTSSGDTQTELSQSLWGLWVLVCTRFVWALWASLVGMGFESKHNFTPPTILLGLLLCSWTWGISSQLLPHGAAAIPLQRNLTKKNESKKRNLFLDTTYSMIFSHLFHLM